MYHRNAKKKHGWMNILLQHSNGSIMDLRKSKDFKLLFFYKLREIFLNFREYFSSYDLFFLWDLIKNYLPIVSFREQPINKDM